MPSFTYILNAVRLLPMLGTIGVIFYFSHQPGDFFNLPEIWSLDKILHIVAYGFLATTVIFAFPPQVRQRSSERIVACVLCVCLTYGISDEIHQSFIPGRFPSIFDVVADLIGGVFVAFAWIYMSAKRRYKKAHVDHT